MKKANIFPGSMLRKSLAVFTIMGISLLLVNLDSSRRFNPAQSHATENNDQTNENNKVMKTEFGRTEDGQKVYLLTNANGLEVFNLPNLGSVDKISTSTKYFVYFFEHFQRRARQ